MRLGNKNCSIINRNYRWCQTVQTVFYISVTYRPNHLSTSSHNRREHQIDCRNVTSAIVQIM